MSAGRDAYAGVSCTRMDYYTAGRRWQYLASTTFGIRVGGMPCRLTSTVARSAVRYSSMPNISLNMKPLIRIVRSAEARRFSTCPRHLSRKRPERAEIYLLTSCPFWCGSATGPPASPVSLSVRDHGKVLAGCAICRCIGTDVSCGRRSIGDVMALRYEIDCLRLH